MGLNSSIDLIILNASPGLCTIPKTCGTSAHIMVTVIFENDHHYAIRMHRTFSGIGSFDDAKQEVLRRDCPRSVIPQQEGLG